MFDIGWAEMAVIALLALVVIGPKELPQAMRTAAKWARKARGLAREFQSGVDDMIREADLEDAKKTLDAARSMDLEKTIGDTLDPTGSVEEEALDLESTARREAPDGEASDGFGSIGEDYVPPESDEEEAGDAAGATVIEHPVKVAPPDSVTPPPEPDQAEAGPGEPEAPAAASTGDDTSQKSA
jgi:sec-independent protein translocase protein TatB